MKTLRNLLFVALASTAMSGFAGVHDNGFALNGLALNGIQLNALSINGLSINGVHIQGLKQDLNFKVTPTALAKLASKPLVK